MKSAFLLFLSVSSLLFAKTVCYDFDDYVGYSNDLVEIKKFVKLNFLKNGNAKLLYHFGISKPSMNFRYFSKIKQSLNFLI